MDMFDCVELGGEGTYEVEVPGLVTFVKAWMHPTTKKVWVWFQQDADDCLPDNLTIYEVLVIKSETPYPGEYTHIDTVFGDEGALHVLEGSILSEEGEDDEDDDDEEEEGKSSTDGEDEEKTKEKKEEEEEKEEEEKEEEEDRTVAKPRVLDLS